MKSEPSENIFRQHMKMLQRDFEELILRDDADRDLSILSRLALDIKQINEDLLLLEGRSLKNREYHVLHDLITKPWGAPFVAKKTLLEAALSYDEAKGKRTDLYLFLDELKSHCAFSGNQLLTMIRSILKEL